MMIAMVVNTLVAAVVGSPIQVDHPESKSIDGVTVRVEALELSRFHGETSSALGDAQATLIPHIDRAIVLTTSILGSNEYESPTLQLANGKRINPTLMGNQIRRGVIQFQPSTDADTSVDEWWFEVDSDLDLAEIFPCRLTIRASDGRARMTTFTFRELTP